MANITLAQVTISAEKVGPELKAFVDLTNSSDPAYNILHTPYGLEKGGNTWTFRGSGEGRWNYESNLISYFSNVRFSKSMGYSILNELAERDGLEAASAKLRSGVEV